MAAASRKRCENAWSCTFLPYSSPLSLTAAEALPAFFHIGFPALFFCLAPSPGGPRRPRRGSTPGVEASRPVGSCQRLCRWTGGRGELQDFVPKRVQNLEAPGSDLRSATKPAPCGHAHDLSWGGARSPGGRSPLLGEGNTRGLAAGGATPGPPSSGAR